MKNTLKGKWALDTNLFIYALDKNSPYFKKTFALFTLIEKKQIKAVISTQNIAEAVNDLTNTYNLLPVKAVLLIDGRHGSFLNSNFKC